MAAMPAKASKVLMRRLDFGDDAGRSDIAILALGLRKNPPVLIKAVYTQIVNKALKAITFSVVMHRSMLSSQPAGLHLHIGLTAWFRIRHLGYTGERKLPAFEARFRLRSWPVREAVSLPRSPSPLHAQPGCRAHRQKPTRIDDRPSPCAHWLTLLGLGLVQPQRAWFRENCSKSRYGPPRL
jgi:hypothetical protein